MKNSRIKILWRSVFIFRIFCVPKLALFRPIFSVFYFFCPFLFSSLISLFFFKLNFRFLFFFLKVWNLFRPWLPWLPRPRSLQRSRQRSIQQSREQRARSNARESASLAKAAFELQPALIKLFIPQQKEPHASVRLWHHHWKHAHRRGGLRRTIRARL